MLALTVTEATIALKVSRPLAMLGPIVKNTI
jgi:hypothetical protein